MCVRLFDPTDLPPLQRLVNRHLTAVIPGWALSETALTRHLRRDGSEPITDPWVRERVTLCAVESEGILAAVHLLRYRDDPEVGSAYRGAGEISWFLAQPDRGDAASAVLAAGDEYLARWAVSHIYGWGSGLPAGPLWGVPDVWPHILGALETAGYHPSGHREALYGGWLGDRATPTEPPMAGLTVRRRVTAYETRLLAVLAGEEVGFCDVQPDLTDGGLSPSLAGWGWLTDLQVSEGWRNQGIGRWLVQHAVRWLQLAGCDRIVLAVADESEVAGAGRFYRRFGWDVLTREAHGWRRHAEQHDGAS
ncbi:MAG: GNAT family N-acetyltransferase [Chloroflexi bacterium]|nr:GNAT family N-acetyltransferase [Chloroflexota bacterium]